MKISFLGDVMLGRFVQEKYNHQKYKLISQEVEELVTKSNLVVANLESPLTNEEAPNSLAFAGDVKLLSELSWIDLFSLSNNHINDFGEKGITDTLKNLEKAGFKNNGIYTDYYKPFLFEENDCKIAIVTCTAMLNYELMDNSPYKTLQATSLEVNEIIKKYSNEGYFVILFSHSGVLFSRFTSPNNIDVLHSAIDSGAKCIVTCHSHCLGGAEYYNNTLIIHGLGDFLMDGGSYRRRRSCILSLQIDNNVLHDWNITPTITNNSLQVVLPSPRERTKINNGFEFVSKKIKKKQNSYGLFYKWQYKVEMIQHSMSTLHFLYDTKGFWGFLKMLKVRYYDVFMMLFRMIMGKQKKFDPNSKHKLKLDEIR